MKYATLFINISLFFCVIVWMDLSPYEDVRYV